MSTELKDMKKKEKAKGIIFEIEQQRLNGEVIGKIASGFHYVFKETLVDDLAGVLLDRKEIAAIAVVNKEHKTQGIIVRTKLFDTLSKPFGRDLYKNKPVTDIMEEVESVKAGKNIFVVAEQHDSIINNSHIRYFALENDSKEYNGIFSTRDLLIYLSELTMKDIAMAKKLQLQIVNEERTYISDKLEIIAATKMAKGIGGDFYSAKKYNDTNWVVTLCDVSGKGVSASLISVTLSGMFNLYDFNQGVKPFISSVNDYIFNTFESGKFVTGVFIDINEETGEMTVFDMGHSYLYVYGNKRAERIESPKGNIPLGIVPGVEPEAKKLALKENEMLITISDGIEEQTNIEGEEYSVSRFMNVLIKNIKLGSAKLRKTVFSQIKDFRKGQALQDDMTYVVVKRK